jgi:hypothetical protein
MSKTSRLTCKNSSVTQPPLSHNSCHPAPLSSDPPCMSVSRARAWFIGRNLTGRGTREAVREGRERERDSVHVGFQTICAVDSVWLAGHMTWKKICILVPSFSCEENLYLVPSFSYWSRKFVFGAVILLLVKKICIWCHHSLVKKICIGANIFFLVKKICIGAIVHSLTCRDTNKKYVIVSFCLHLLIYLRVYLFGLLVKKICIWCQVHSRNLYGHLTKNMLLLVFVCIYWLSCLCIFLYYYISSAAGVKRKRLSCCIGLPVWRCLAARFPCTVVCEPCVDRQPLVTFPICSQCNTAVAGDVAFKDSLELVLFIGFIHQRRLFFAGILLNLHNSL